MFNPFTSLIQPQTSTRNCDDTLGIHQKHWRESKPENILASVCDKQTTDALTKTFFLSRIPVNRLGRLSERELRCGWCDMPIVPRVDHLVMQSFSPETSDTLMQGLINLPLVKTSYVLGYLILIALTIDSLCCGKQGQATLSLISRFC